MQGGAHHPHGASAGVEAVLGGVGVEGAGPPAHRADAPSFLLQGKVQAVFYQSILRAQCYNHYFYGPTMRVGV